MKFSSIRWVADRAGMLFSNHNFVWKHMSPSHRLFNTIVLIPSHSKGTWYIILITFHCFVVSLTASIQWYSDGGRFSICKNEQKIKCNIPNNYFQSSYPFSLSLSSCIAICGITLPFLHLVSPKICFILVSSAICHHHNLWWYLCLSIFCHTIHKISSKLPSDRSPHCKFSLKFRKYSAKVLH